MIAIAVFQVPPLLKEQQYRELLGFGLVWCTAAVYALLVVARVPLPVVIDVLNFIYERIPFLKTGM
ncbi:MAG: hypothetical protein C4554_07165 [Dethiobacter sp.]|jgi:hypothetical protein|nr:MAG: hypothetical protein C4554_07165 [Dethiobacter sp.]